METREGTREKREQEISSGSKMGQFKSQVEQEEFLLKSDTKIATLEGNQGYWQDHGGLEWLFQMQHRAQNFRK